MFILILTGIFGAIAYSIAGFTTFHIINTVKTRRYKTDLSAYDKKREEWEANNTHHHYTTSNMHYYMCDDIGSSPPEPVPEIYIPLSVVWPVVAGFYGIYYFLSFVYNNIVSPTGFGLLWAIKVIAKFPNRAGRMIAGWVV